MDENDLTKYMLFSKDGKVSFESMKEVADKICLDLNLPLGSVDVTDEAKEGEYKGDGKVIGKIGAIRETHPALKRKQDEPFKDIRLCGNCKIVGNLKCSRCKIQAYCCVHCQRADWKAHKLICVKKE